jgi:hypothetical protein
MATSLEPAFENLEIRFYLFDRETHAIFEATLQRLADG